MKANHVLRTVPRLLLPLLVALAHVPLTAQAQTRPTITPQAGLSASSLGSGTYSISVGGAAGNLPATLPAGGSASVGTGSFTWSMKVPPGSTGTMGPVASTAAKFPVPGAPGKTIPITIDAPANRPSAAKAIAKFAKRVGPVAQAVAAWELLNDLGVIGQKNPDTGEWEFITNQPATHFQIVVSGPWTGALGRNDGGYWVFWRPTIAEACTEWARQYSARIAPVTAVPSGIDACQFSGSLVDRVQLHLPNCGDRQWISYTSTDCRLTNPNPPGGSPATTEQVEEKLRDTSSPKLPRAIAEAINAGEPVEVESPTVTGPASVPTGTKEVTKQNPDGSREVTTTTTNTTATYTNNTIKLTNVTTNVTNYYNSTNVQTGTSTTTTTEPPPPGELEEKASECAKNPDTIGCSKYGEVPDAQLPTKDMSVSFAPLPFQSNASCPDPASFQLVNLGEASGSYSLSFAPLCSAATTYVRPLVLLISAALAAFIFVGGLKT